MVNVCKARIIVLSTLPSALCGVISSPNSPKRYVPLLSHCKDRFQILQCMWMDERRGETKAAFAVPAKRSLLSFWVLPLLLCLWIT